MKGGKKRWLLVPIAALLAVICGFIMYWLLGREVTGVVVDITGKPIAGATVKTGWQKTTTDENGQYTLRALLGGGATDIIAEYHNEQTIVQIPELATSSEIVVVNNTEQEISTVYGPGDVQDIFGEPGDAGGLTSEEINELEQEIREGHYPEQQLVSNVNVVAQPVAITIPIAQDPIELPPPVDPDAFIVNEEGLEVIAGEILVGWEEDVSSSERKNIVEQAGGIVRFDNDAAQTTIVYVAEQVHVPAVVEKLTQSEQVTGALPNYRLEPDTAPNDPDYTDKNKRWFLQRLNAEPMWAMTKGRSSVIVAVIDVGFETNHPDLAGTFTPASLNYTRAALSADAKHGTHVSGTIAARQNNGLGLTGIAPNVRLFPVKINDLARLPSVFERLSSFPNVRIATMSMGWVWSKRNARRVKNGEQPFTEAFMRAKSEELDRIIRPAFMNFYEKGGVMCKSAGNDYGLDARLNGLNYPEVITVGASQPNWSLTNFSNTGPKVDIVAPGWNIWSTINGGTYGYLSGTSMATPLVAGTVAAIRSVRPQYGPLIIKRILQRSSEQSGRLVGTTYVHLDSWRALLRATKLFGITGSVETEEYTPAENVIVTAKSSQWNILTDAKGEFVIPFLTRKQWTLEAKKGEAKAEEKIDSPALSDDEVLEFVNLVLEKKEETNENSNTNENTNEENENENANGNENTNDNENTNEGTTNENDNENSNSNNNTNADSSGDSVDSDSGNTGGYTLDNGIVVSASGCAESGFSAPEKTDDQCAAGFYFSRETIACEQTTCPNGAGRTYTLECKCPEGTKALYACTVGLVVACVPE
ncbi:MAG TPA: S8 family serine peptidase [Patescibacteria group bacterium]|nr:S8 family serine peptidase [Patescibacteria group bacterium]